MGTLLFASSSSVGIIAGRVNAPDSALGSGTISARGIGGRGGKGAGSTLRLACRACRRRIRRPRSREGVGSHLSAHPLPPRRCRLGEAGRGGGARGGGDG